MRIKEAISPSTPLAIPFEGGAVLNIEYRPASVSLADMEAMVEQAERVAADQNEEAEARKNETADAAQLRRLRERLQQAKKTLAENILSIVVSWDLEFDEGGIVPLNENGLVTIPYNVFTEILKAVRRHQGAGEEGK